MVRGRPRFVGAAASLLRLPGPRFVSAVRAAASFAVFFAGAAALRPRIAPLPLVLVRLLAVVIRRAIVGLRCSSLPQVIRLSQVNC